MVDAQDLAILKSSPYRLEVTVALLAMAAGLPAGKALEDIRELGYQAGQQSVVDDPQAWGLEVRPC
jgi:hypothetical protein